MTKEQAGIVAATAAKMVAQSEMLQSIVRYIPSSKRLVSLTNGSEFKSMARDGPAAMGLNGRVVILDEVGSIEGESGQDDFVDAMTSCTGAWDDAIIFAISTQAASDGALFSRWLDDAQSAQDPQTVCHLYQADPDCDLLDEVQWQYANPGLGISRSFDDLKAQLTEASRLPSKEANARVLLLNQRVQRNNAWLSPSVWKGNMRPFDMDVFRSRPVVCGLDLAMVNDLCCAAIAAKDDEGEIHLRVYSFSPLDGIADRSRRDRVPYDQWQREGHIYSPPGKTLDYDMIAQYLALEFEREGISIGEIHFDRWKSDTFFAACDRQGFAQEATRHEVGQGFKDIGIRISALETILLQGKLRAGNQPTLNLAMASAVVETDPAMNRKLTKAKSQNKIDAAVATLMATYPLIAQLDGGVDVSSWIA
jgi:phage terminase large subunit-like protein